MGILAAISLGEGAVAQSPSGLEKSVKPLLKTYCLTCHRGTEKQGNLSLDQFASDQEAARNPELWWKVLKNLRAGVMPPAGEAKPQAAELQPVYDWIKFDVFKIRRDDVDPGATHVRRLNRREFGNTVNDLMGINFNAELILPADDSGFGFDNVGDALTFSPLLMEKYLQAAQMIVDQAVPKVTWVTPRQEFSGRDFVGAGSRGDARGNSLDGKKPARVRHVAKIDEPGKYTLHLNVKLHGSFDFDAARYTVAFSVDGKERSNKQHGWDENKLLRDRFEVEWQPGDHDLAFELTPIPSSEEDESARLRVGGDPTNVRFEVSSVRIEGPLGTHKRVHPSGYERFFTRNEPPADPIERRQYAAEILRRFGTRAFRGPIAQPTVDRLVKIAEDAYGLPGKTFEEGIARAMAAVLSSPRFLFRLESTISAPHAADYAPIDELSLASRMSYFLWSTMPDDELFRLAEAGELRRQLPQQIERMQRDLRAEEFIRNFVGQWLRTRDVTQVSVDPIVVLGYQEEYEKLLEQLRSRFRRRGPPEELTPEEQKRRDRFRELRAISDRFNDELKRAMRRETEMCFEYLVREDRSLLELIDADYTFLNEKLAEHYGIPNVRGSEMRKVQLPEGSLRGGVLTQASMLLVTSNPTRTSPVKRGLFILDNILGTPAPPAPAAVPDLEESAKKFGDKQPTLRELLAAHRESPLCASCHARMDPLGLALENFNALGLWRGDEKGRLIDTSGTLITGETFRDSGELKRILREQHSADFYRCVTEKLLTYALGRGLEFSDVHTIDVIVQKLEQSDGRFSSLLQGVIESAPFQKQRIPRGTLGPRRR